MTSTTPYQGAPIDARAQETNASGVSWPAVIAGAVTTAALVLILLSLGAGLGLSSVSPWANVGASASGIGKSAIIWLNRHGDSQLSNGRLSGWTPSHQVDDRALG